MAIGHLPDCGILGRGPLRYPGIVPRLPLKTELILDMWRKWSDKRRECLVSWRMRRRVWRCGYILVDPTQWLNTRSGFKSMVKHMIYIYIYMTWHDMTWHDMNTYLYFMRKENMLKTLDLQPPRGLAWAAWRRRVRGSEARRRRGWAAAGGGLTYHFWGYIDINVINRATIDI